MAKMKFELNRSGVRELMQSDEMQKCVQEYANKILEKCDGDYDTDHGVGGTRAWADVHTTTEKGYYKELQSNTLLKGLKQ